ncbi:carotenoid oxygenase family protein [Nostoc sp. CALU 546]|uniref:carotenoid oxygenase family protein n=1 Tax=Nostoc sp. CALU 546 TaxID=1867241 RepID=UPI003B6747C7
MVSKDVSSKGQPSKSFHIPKSVIKTSRHEGCWHLEIRKQENQDRQNEIIPLAELQLAELPAGLHGYAFIVGALFQSENKPQEDGTQLYTGDGMVYRLGFEDGKAILKTRIAKTPCYYADPATQFYLGDYAIEPIPFTLFRNKILSYFVKKYKCFSYFSAFRNGGPSRYSIVLGSRNQLNTAFLKTRDHLLLTMDAGRAYQLDPDSMELLEPVGSTEEWCGIFPVISKLTWINIFETYISSAHYVTDLNSLNGKRDELFTTNYSTGYNGNFKKIVNWVLDSSSFRKVVKSFYALLQIEFNPKQELGRFTHLIRYRFADEQKGLQATTERWRLVLPDGEPVLVDQSLHQLAITEKYIILADIAFKMEFSQIFTPFLFGFLRLWKFNRTYSLGSWIYAVFFQAIKPLPFASLYIVNRQDLDQGNIGYSIADLPGNRTTITVQKVRLPREISHFTADYFTDDYSNPDNKKIIIHVGHVNGWDVTEWITRHDTPVPDKPFREDLEGMMVGSTDLGSLGRYVVDGETGKIESCETVQDIQSTWALSLYTHRELNRDSLTETAKQVKNIYWLSLGFTWELIPQRIYDAYKSDPRRVVPVEQLPEENKPITLLRLDTQQMKIVDSYHFPSGSYVSSMQFIPSSLPCPEDIDESIHGFIVCTVMLDPDPSQSDRATDEFWIFHADNLKNKPIYRLSASSDSNKKPLNLAMTIHSTWLPDIRQQQYSVEERHHKREESVKKDYQHLIEKKGKAVQELFNDIVFPEFTKQTLEEDFEKFLLPKDE